MFSGGLTSFGIICGSVYENNGEGRYQRLEGGRGEVITLPSGG